VQQDRTGSATTRSFFVFVGPASVVSQRFATEEIRLLRSRGRIVYQHHEDLAAIVSSVAFVIVPALFRRLDTVTDENEIRIDVDRLCLRASERDEVVSKLERLTATRARDRQRRTRIRFDADERNRLKETAVSGGAFSSERFELCGDVFRGELTTARACAAAFEHVIS